MLRKILIEIILLSVVQCRLIEDLLTKKQSRLWLLNETASMLNHLNKYCSICCVDVNQIYKGRKCGIHTMCIYGMRRPGPACQGLIKMDFSQNEIDAIVDAHNTLRNKIALGLEQDGDPGPQPSAANMRLVSWDHELAEVASVWAAQCVYAHDKCRDLARFPVGQNVANGSYASKNNLEHIAEWYSLVQYFRKEMLESYNLREEEEDLSHYTQLVWADTYLIGCARVSFQRPINGHIEYQELFFCNYGPSGNIPHQSVYKFGEACSACAEGTFCTNPEYPGLCGNEFLNKTFIKKQRKKHSRMESNKSKVVEVNNFILKFLMLYFIFFKVNKLFLI